MMSKTVTFTVEGKPKAKGRPRFTRTGHAYTDSQTRDYEELVGTIARCAMRGNDPLTGPLHVSVTVTLKAPTAYRKAERELAQTQKLPATTGSDVDNYAKAILDAINGITYADDRQISRLIVSKEYGELPRVEVTIAQMPANLSLDPTQQRCHPS